MDKAKIDRILRVSRKRVKEDLLFQKSPYYPLAKFFVDTLVLNGYPSTSENWSKTKAAAKDIVDNHNHIPEIEWRACIKWCFGSAKLADSFWGKVPITNLGTVVKIYPTFRSYQESSVGKKRGTRLDDYGTIRK